MAGSTVELDFFGMEKEITPKPLPNRKLFDRRRSFKDIQGVISKLNPELLKTVIACGSADQKNLIGKSVANSNSLLSASNSIPTKAFAVPSTPKPDDHHGNLNLFPSMPVYAPPTAFGCNAANYGGISGTAPLTIFYNGSVTVFELPREKAENILKFAEEGASRYSVVEPTEKLDKDSDLPMPRKKSLQRFLEKRKERVPLASPYSCPADSAFPGPKE